MNQQNNPQDLTQTLTQQAGEQLGNQTNNLTPEVQQALGPQSGIEKLQGIIGQANPQEQIQKQLGQDKIPQVAQNQPTQQRQFKSYKVEPGSSAHVLSTIQNPIGKFQENQVKRAEKEQEQLEKQYGKQVEEYRQKAQVAQTNKTALEQQAALVNSGKLPDPVAESLRNFVGKTGPKAIGAAIGSALGGAGGAFVGGSALPSVDLSSFSGTEGNELMALNVKQYENFKNLFQRGTENEFHKYEQSLPKLTDTNEVKIKKINNNLYEQEKAEIINNHIEKIIEDNNGFYVRNLLKKAEDQAKPELKALEIAHKKGTFGFKYKPQEGFWS